MASVFTEHIVKRWSALCCGGVSVVGVLVVPSDEFRCLLHLEEQWLVSDDLRCVSEVLTRLRQSGDGPHDFSLQYIRQVTNVHEGHLRGPGVDDLHQAAVDILPHELRHFQLQATRDGQGSQAMTQRLQALDAHRQTTRQSGCGRSGSSTIPKQ